MIEYAIFLRALAAILITNSHYNSVYPIEIIASGGLLGDVIFFALSGFVLVNIKEDFLNWYKKRLLRIYPSIWIITLIYILLGFYTFDDWSIASYFLYPTYYHFIASIVVLYIPYYFIAKNDYFKNRVPIIMLFVFIFQLIIYLFFYNKTYYHIDTVREPMIKFLFFQSMLMGLYFRINHAKYVNRKKNMKWLLLTLSVILYFVTKLAFVRIEDISNYQIINQLTLFIFLYLLFKCFASIENELTRFPQKVRMLVNFIANITLQIYAVQYVIIPKFASIVFPLNWLIITSMIIISAYLLYRVGNILGDYLLRIVDRVLLAQKLKRLFRMKDLLLTGAFNYNEKHFKELKNIGYNIIFVQDEREPLKLDVSNIEAVVCNNLFIYNDISEFKELKVVQLTSAGLDRVPIDYIIRNNIKFYNARGIYSIPMAEWVILKILELYKRSKIFYKNQELHKWEKQRDLLELTDKTAAIIGFGSVGKEVAKRLKAFGVKIISVDRKRIDADYVDESLVITNIDDALKKSDIIILTIPLTNETKHLINRERISKLKEDAIIVNVARGSIIDESALIDTLNKGKLLGIALDVFEEEPLELSPLWDFDNAIITPHNSYMSNRINERLFRLILKNLSRGDNS